MSSAEIAGAQANPKGLRSEVSVLWQSIRSTIELGAAIYTQATGAEERVDQSEFRLEVGEATDYCGHDKM